MSFIVQAQLALSKPIIPEQEIFTPKPEITFVSTAFVSISEINITLNDINIAFHGLNLQAINKYKADKNVNKFLTSMFNRFCRVDKGILKNCNGQKYDGLLGSQIEADYKVFKNAFASKNKYKLIEIANRFVNAIENAKNIQSMNETGPGVLVSSVSINLAENIETSHNKRMKMFNEYQNAIRGQSNDEINTAQVSFVNKILRTFCNYDRNGNPISCDVSGYSRLNARDLLEMAKKWKGGSVSQQKFVNFLIATISQKGKSIDDFKTLVSPLSPYFQMVGQSELPKAEGGINEENHFKLMALIKFFDYSNSPEDKKVAAIAITNNFVKINLSGKITIITNGYRGVTKKLISDCILAINSSENSGPSRLDPVKYLTLRIKLADIQEFPNFDTIPSMVYPTVSIKNSFEITQIDREKHIYLLSLIYRW